VILLRASAERGHSRLDWLDSRHTFSFDRYQDERWMGFRSLRVINEDRVAPGAGFGTHPHRDMEIITYVLDGALQHRDSLGNGSIIRPGDVQRMSAGTGVTHSEYNPSPSEPVHFLQIWIVPAQMALPPGYEQRSLMRGVKSGVLRRLAGTNGGDDAVTVHQDATLFAARLDRGQAVTHQLGRGRGAWVQVARGTVRLNDTHLGAGDGAALTEEPRLALVGESDAEVLLFDLA
jgi:redox-sensitive bicupin YhaK (pirin superfamily)